MSVSFNGSHKDLLGRRDLPLATAVPCRIAENVANIQAGFALYLGETL
jgi:hypothetical protein